MAIDWRCVQHKSGHLDICSRTNFIQSVFHCLNASFDEAVYELTDGSVGLM